jgi:hypothetical protein
MFKCPSPRPLPWFRPLLRLLQTGLCLLATYSLIIHCVYYGLLAWYFEESSPARIGEWVASRIFSHEGRTFWSGFAFHSVINCWRAVSRSAPAGPQTSTKAGNSNDVTEMTEVCPGVRAEIAVGSYVKA